MVEIQMTICNVFGICCSSKKVLCSFTPQHLHLPWYGVPTCKITLLSIMCSDMLNCLSVCHLPWYGVPTCEITLLSIMCIDMLNIVCLLVISPDMVCQHVKLRYLVLCVVTCWTVCPFSFQLLYFLSFFEILLLLLPLKS